MQQSLEILKKLSKPIAFGHYSSATDIGGVTSWLQRTLLKLHQEGVPLVVLLHYVGEDPMSSNLYHTLNNAGILVEIEPIQGLKNSIKSVISFLNRYQPQVFMPQCLEGMYYSAAIAGCSGLPWALSMRSDEQKYWDIAKAVPPENYGGMMVGVSKYICEKAISSGLAKNPQQAPSGTPIPAFTAKFCNSPFRVVFSGRVVETQKRFSLVLETMAHACRKDLQIECLILGEGEEQTWAQHWVRTQGLEKCIQFLGRLSPDLVQEQLSQCQAILLMSDYEGLPVALLEAMAIGLVPIARNIPSGIPELIQHHQTGLLTNENPLTTAEAICYLSKDPALWLKCSEGAKDLVNRIYSQEVCFNQWVDIIALLSTKFKVNYPIKISRYIKLGGIDLEFKEYHSSLRERISYKLRSFWNLL